ncbi:MAG: bifunctional nuclease family protein [Bacteroidales bacterium]|nr:bifunctional nuclease family protein [Bacteroidales bacterium]
MMDKEIQVHGYDLTCHEVTMTRLIKLTDEQGNTILNVPMEMFAVRTFFRCLMESDIPGIPAHKMFLDVIEILGGKLQKVVIDELQKGVFFATLHLTKNDAGKITIKAEASDALAMAFRAPCYVYIRESVLATAKNDSKNRVHWYDPKDEETLKTVRAATQGELLLYPEEELSQLIEIAIDIEDYTLAAKLKKALQDKL